MARLPFYLAILVAPGLTGCASFFYGAGERQKVEGMQANVTFLTATAKQVRNTNNEGFLASTLFELTPLGIISPVFGYPDKTWEYSQTVALHIDPEEATEKTGTTHEFHASPGKPEEWVLDFNVGAKEKLKDTGRVRAYKPPKVKITVSCDKHSCSSVADPPVVGPNGALRLEARDFEDKKRLKEIADAERRQRAPFEAVLRAVPARLRPDIRYVGNLADVTAHPETFQNQLVAINTMDSPDGVKWVPNESGTEYSWVVGFTLDDPNNHPGWKGSLVKENPNPRRITPAGYLNFSSQDHVKATLCLEDAFLNVNHFFLARVIGNGLGQVKNTNLFEASAPTPVFGIFLQPVAVYTSTNRWETIDPTYVSRAERERAIALVESYKIPKLSKGSKQARKRGRGMDAFLTVADYVKEFDDEHLRRLRQQKYAAASPKMGYSLDDVATLQAQAYANWWVIGNKQGNLVVTRSEATVSDIFGVEHSLDTLEFEVDLRRHAVRPVGGTATRILGRYGFLSTQPWQDVEL
jgi:hypothetical protein